MMFDAIAQILGNPDVLHPILAVSELNAVTPTSNFRMTGSQSRNAFRDTFSRNWLTSGQR
jgi:hypothetical protein